MFEGLEQILSRLNGYSAWKVAAQFILIWLVVFYLATLALEIGLVVKELSAANPPPQQ